MKRYTKTLRRKVQENIKRFVDIVVSFLAIILMLPILFITAVIIKVSIPGPIFFFQERVGRNGEVFRIYKFRTMKVDAIAESTQDFSKDNERLTSVGRVLRRLKIDEIPQLLNVFIGTMSLVGPRPTVKKQVDSYSDFQRKRLLMKPGMTGFAQVNGNITLSWSKRIQYDVYYVMNFNLAFDLYILLKTVVVVIFGEKKFSRKAK